MDREILTAIIGVVSTLLGTILGWLLNNFSNRGKLRIYTTSWEDKFSARNHIGESQPCTSKEKVEYYSFIASFDLYNSSGETKIMRNVQIVFSDGKNAIWQGIPEDQDTQRYVAHAYWYDKVEPVNIPPKTVIKLNLRDGLYKNDGSLDCIWKAKKVILQYQNEKNRRKRILIKKENYAEYFINHHSHVE